MQAEQFSEISYPKGQLDLFQELVLRCSQEKNVVSTSLSRGNQTPVQFQMDSVVEQSEESLIPALINSNIDHIPDPPGNTSPIQANEEPNILIEEKNEPLIQIQIHQPQPQLERNQQNTYKFDDVFTEKSFDQRTTNAVRFIVGLNVDHLPQFKDQYEGQVGQRMAQKCRKLREWHLEKKKNVYKLEHLSQFLSDEHELQQGTARNTRKLTNRILRQHALKSLFKPKRKSQIQNKIAYLRVAKIFALRCRSSKLINRNEAR